ncbi:MAG: DUF1893 domain-containing protein [Candidatus Bathyarchaeota archaeon]|jgi:hypothetical protein|nr:DUF1893 domain-containing protein [Candidatus Bathyarchaeota archaeon]
MLDLEIAKNRLQSKDVTLVIVKNGEMLFETEEHKIKGFLGAIEKLGKSLEGSSIADRVVGKAIALLCVYSKVYSVYAAVLSKEAKRILEKYQISHEWSIIVEEILNLEKNRACPFEMKARNMSDPKKTYFELKRLLNN